LAAHLADISLSPPQVANKAIVSSHPVFQRRHRQRALRGCAANQRGQEELQEWHLFLRQTGSIHRHRLKIPKGVPAVRPRPGTCKTLLAKAIAGEAGMPSSRWRLRSSVRDVVVVGASRWRDLFKRARKEPLASCSIDKLVDAVGRRSAAPGTRRRQRLA